MNNEEKTDFVNVPQRREGIANPVPHGLAKNHNRDFTGLFCSWELAEIVMDHKNLKYLRLSGETSEGRLAAHFRIPMRDPKFQASLARLESRGLITRRTKEWGFRGEWVDLTDEARELFLTAKGSYFAAEKYEPEVSQEETPSTQGE
jgi:hypothetical protein